MDPEIFDPENSPPLEIVLEIPATSAQACASPSKKRLHSPEKTEANESFDEGQNCPICFEPYTNSGPHRLTCLKCGHLFGKSCIKKWISASGKQGYCPQCKSHAKLIDIRDHYCRGVKILDTHEKEEALTELQKERETKRTLQIEFATLKQKYETLVQEMETVRCELTRVKDRTFSSGESNENLSRPSGSNDGQFGTLFQTNFERRLEICRSGESRVMAFIPQMATLAVSAHPTTTLFNRFGLKKVDMHNCRVTEFLPIHGEVIRDVRIDGTTALTASFDKTMALTCFRDNHPNQKWNVGSKVWSCCFKNNEAHYLFSASQGGKVKMYDKRMIVEEREDGGALLEICDLKKPVFNLNWVDNGADAQGLLVTSVDRCLFFKQNSQIEFRPIALPSEGKLYSLSYNDSSGHILVSCGPSLNKRVLVEHSVYSFGVGQNVNMGEVSGGASLIRTFNGGDKQTMMCRNLLLENPKDRTSLLAAVYDEASNSLQFWNSASGSLIQRRPLANESIYDMSVFKVDRRSFFCSLNNKFLTINIFD